MTKKVTSKLVWEMLTDEQVHLLEVYGSTLRIRRRATIERQRRTERTNQAESGQSKAIARGDL